MSKKLTGILTGVAVAAFGLLLLLTSILDSLDVVNVIFGVVLMLLGAACVALAVLGLVKEKKLEFKLCLGATAGLFLGLMVILNQLNIFAIFALLVYAVPPVGLALLAHGIFMICKKETVPGLIKAGVGVAATVIGMLYLFVESFQQVFWIIVAILLLVYGAYMIVMACLKKE